jgi:NAD(P)-dependent dehydrogenase (short-subunit alcohol dehydrogenase family)
MSIINMASIAARRAVSLGSVYSMSKHALLGLTKSVAREYADKNVRCNAISPVSSLCRMSDVRCQTEPRALVLHAE